MVRPVAVLGLGEAGRLLAADLLGAGAVVRGYDPRPTPDVDGLRRCGSEAEAVHGCGVVLSVNSAKDAEPALVAALRDGSTVDLWADLNTAAPAVKQRLAAVCEEAGVPFVDVALMAPVPGLGLRTPMLASGNGAATYAAFLAGYGHSAEIVGGEAGIAATRKLLRSIFFKGMAATVIEALRAADAHGLGDWLRDHIEEELQAADRALVGRLVSGTERHATRRAHELRAAIELARAVDTPSFVSEATLAWLELIDAENREPS
jgi:3-hydroxyisobutyrate dehydrogenase-like beta-hydroxyacid dehydrogenase